MAMSNVHGYGENVRRSDGQSAAKFHRAMEQRAETKC